MTKNLLDLLLRLLPALCLLPLLPARAQTTCEARLDSAEILIGEQTDLAVRVSAAAKSHILWPDLAAGRDITPGVEVIQISEPDTTWLNDGRRMQISRRYTLSAFDSALYVIPPFEVEVDGKKVASRGKLGLKVLTVPIDTLHVEQHPGPHAVVVPPYEWRPRLLLWSLLLLLMLAAVYALAMRLSNRLPMTRCKVIYPPAPPHVTALATFSRLSGKKAANATAPDDAETERERVKAYYAELTAALRRYIAERFGFNAREMTTSEITRRLLADENTEALQELRDVMQQADLVKFAKFEVSLSDEDKSLHQALAYVQTTKVEPVEKPQPKVVYEDLALVTQHRIRILLWVLAILLGVASAGLLAFLCAEIYNNFL